MNLEVQDSSLLLIHCHDWRLYPPRHFPPSSWNHEWSFLILKFSGPSGLFFVSSAVPAKLAPIQFHFSSQWLNFIYFHLNEKDSLVSKSLQCIQNKLKQSEKHFLDSFFCWKAHGWLFFFPLFSFFFLLLASLFAFTRNISVINYRVIIRIPITFIFQKPFHSGKPFPLPLQVCAVIPDGFARRQLAKWLLAPNNSTLVIIHAYELLGRKLLSINFLWHTECIICILLLFFTLASRLTILTDTS